MTLPDLAAAWMRRLPPEAAHRWTIRLLKKAPTGKGPVPVAPQTVFGLTFPNPVGIAAGFDKDAEVVRKVFGLGFGFVEVGSITPRPQPGNPRPRVFRLEEDGAVINRYGFNSKGLDYAERQLERARCQPLPGPLGVNLGKNKASGDAAADYAEGARRLARYADYLVVNVSSPNTPSLRALQNVAALRAILESVRNVMTNTRPLLLKVAPDLDSACIDDIACLAASPLLDGLIISNTTIARPAMLLSGRAHEIGGLSGRPLMKPSTEMLRMFRDRVGPDMPIIGVGGIGGTEDAVAKRLAGATLVQLYTALIYEGPAVISAAAAAFLEEIS
ncbi:MAG: quinone-dependent dihydroorotate dehydrogenase [Rhodospirillaceae bacterium]|nr:quinone-dependent dihydroorotate dehydrogenase [Rhodospirillaceae bacterium]